MDFNGDSGFYEDHLDQKVAILTSEVLYEEESIEIQVINETGPDNHQNAVVGCKGKFGCIQCCLCN